MKKTALLVALFLVIGAVPSFAMSNCPLYKWGNEKAKSDNYAVKTVGMLVEGVDGVALSPLHLISGPYNDIVKEKHYATGLFTGLAKGVVGFGKDALTGVWNIATAIVPGYHGVSSE